MKQYGIKWYEQRCDKFRWKTLMISMDIIHAQAKKGDDCNEYQCHGVHSFECSSMYLIFCLVSVHS
jgi:hypothetical protein